MKTKVKKGMFKALATRSVIAAIPVAMVAAYAGNMAVPTPPRLAEYAFQQVAEITVSPDTVGIAASSLYGQTKEQIDAQLDEMLAVGVTNIRVFVPWGTIDAFGAFAPDTFPGTLVWQNIENIMQAAAERNMGVLAEINGTPASGQLDPLGGNFPIGSATPDPAAFAAFLQRFISNTVVVNGASVTYGSIVSAYEIWNEPNYIQFSNAIDPEAYAALVKVAYPAIKALDPTASVVIGAVGATQDSPFTMNTVTFVQRMFAALGPDAASYFDALSIHPYGDETQFSGNCPTCAPGVLTPRQQFEAIAAMQQLTGKKIWITEYGLPTTPGGPFTEADQAAWNKNLLDTWNAYADPTKPTYDAQIAALLGPIFLYTGRDTPGLNGMNNSNDYYGLWNADGTPKDAAQMLKDWLAAQTPTAPATPTANPVAALAAFVQALIRQVSQFVTQMFSQNIVTAFVQAIVHWVGSLAGTAVTTSAPLTLKVASVESTAASTTADPTAPVTAKGGMADVTTATDGVTEAGATTPVVTEPVLKAPVLTVPVLTVPVVTEPVLTVPVVTEPVLTEPVAVTKPELVATEPAATTPTKTDTPSTTTPGASDDTSAKPAKPAKPAAGDESDKASKTGSEDKSADKDKSGDSAKSSNSDKSGSGKQKADRDSTSTGDKVVSGATRRVADPKKVTAGAGAKGASAAGSESSGSDGGGSEG